MVVMISIYIAISINCESSCMDHWINTHRTEPLDFLLWNTKLCSWITESSCNRRMRITLMNFKDLYDENFINEVISSDKYDSYAVVSISNLSTLQTKHSDPGGNYRQITHRLSMIDPVPKDVLAKIKDILKLTSGHVKFCNDKGNRKYTISKDIPLEKRSTIFLLDDIVNKYFTQAKKNPIQLLLFARQSSNCSISLNEVLIFVAAVNFEPGTYIFSNKTYNANLSISQPFYDKYIYITNDGHSYLINWMFFRFPLYILYFYIVSKIWQFTSRIFESKHFYRFANSNRPKYICNPILISANTPLTDLMRSYFFRKSMV